MRVWVQSPHLLVELGLKALLRDQGFVVSDDLGNGVDVAIFDLGHGSIPYPSAPAGIPTLALVYQQDSELPVILRKGFRGYLRRDDGPDVLKEALWALFRGEVWAEGSVLFAMAGLGSETLPTSREQEVFQLIQLGHSNREIAELLDISVSTVKAHVTSLLHKYDVHSRLQLVARHTSTELQEVR